MRFSLLLFESLIFRNKSGLCILKFKKSSFGIIICLTCCLNNKLIGFYKCFVLHWIIKNSSRWNRTFVFQIFRDIELWWSLFNWSEDLFHNFVPVHVAYDWTFESCFNTIIYFLWIFDVLIYWLWVIPLWTLFAQGLLHRIASWQLGRFFSC